MCRRSWNVVMSDTSCSASCSVCCEAYDTRQRKRITCSHCEYSACRLCVQKYITLPESSREASCMDCRHLWNDTFVVEAVTKAFVSGPYKAHRERALFERETSLMPFTQRTIEATREIGALNRRLASLNLERQDLQRRRHVLARLENGFEEHATPALTDETKEWQSDIVLACPSEACRGFVTAGKWRCGVCQIPVCKDCREPLMDPDIEMSMDTDMDMDQSEVHVCQPENIATSRLLNSDTKACPTCASMIFKISGCDQMWCVTCHTAFSWVTGAIVDPDYEQVHNPEFYRYLRGVNNGEIPRDAGVPINRRCNGTGPSTEELRMLLIGMPRSPARDWIQTFHQRLYYLRTYTIPRNYRIEPVNMTAERRHILLRRQYMLGEVSETKFRSLLRTRESRRMRAADFRELGDTLVQISIDVLTTLRLGMKTADLLNVITQLEEARDIFNTSMMTLGQKYGGCKRMHLNEMWTALFVR